MSFGLEDGAIFAGRYRVIRRLAAGAMGVVYEAVHVGTDRRRALKVMHPHIIERPELRERFALEARVTAHVRSELIVEVFDAGVDEATEIPFLVMELLHGEELGKRLQRMGRFASEEALAYLHATALALDKTHQASIIHRDLKPSNIFLSVREDGEPRLKVLDFGVAKIIAESTTAPGATMTVGTPLYMAPEQFCGRHVSAATDIYALGMVAYAFLVGEPYWTDEKKREGSNFVAFSLIAAAGPREPASERAARKGVVLPSGFDAWFAQVTAVDPHARFAAATAAVRALGDVFGVADVAVLGLPRPAEGPSPLEVRAESSEATELTGTTSLRPQDKGITRGFPRGSTAAYVPSIAAALPMRRTPEPRPARSRRSRLLRIASVFLAIACGLVLLRFGSAIVLGPTHARQEPAPASPAAAPPADPPPAAVPSAPAAVPSAPAIAPSAPAIPGAPAQHPSAPPRRSPPRQRRRAPLPTADIDIVDKPPF